MSKVMCKLKISPMSNKSIEDDWGDSYSNSLRNLGPSRRHQEL